MAEKKSIFSFLFSGSDAKRGARDGSDGSKGLTELKSENNLDVSNSIEKAKDVVSKPAHDTVIQDTTKRRQENHAKLHHRSPYMRRPKDLPRKRLNKRNNEIQNQKDVADKTSKSIKKRIAKAPKADEKIIKNFISRLDPSIQEEIRQNMMEQVMKRQPKKQVNKTKTSPTPAPTLVPLPKKEVLPQQPIMKKTQDVQKTFPTAEPKPAEKQMDLREKIEQKRGAYRQSRQSKMLETAKKIAEKARQMVKDFRMRITGQKPNTTKPQKEAPTRTNNRSQKKQNKNINNMLMQQRGREQRGRR